MAVRAQYADVVKDEQGRPIAAASIAVYQVGTTTAITETIYDDASGAGTLSNPLTADSAGRFQFYLVLSKRVDLYVSRTGYTAYTLEDVDVTRTGESGTATFVVAANDASPASKVRADYVCDGTADEVEIQAAIDALPPFTGTDSAPIGGGKVVLSEGRFYINAAIDITDDYMQVQGQGPSTKLYAQANMTDHIFKTSGTTVYGIQIRDLFIQGAGAADGDYHGVNVEGMYDPLLENLWIMQTKGAGIFGNGSTKAFELIKIFNCRLHNCGQYASATYRQGVALLNGDLNMLVNNTSLQSGTDGFYLNAADSSIVRGNQTDTNGGNGYSIVGVTNLIFEGNWSYNDNASSGNAAIEVSSPFSQGLISNNFVLGADKYGIRLGTLTGGANDISDLTCKGNVVSAGNASYEAILIDGAGAIVDSDISHNNLSNNTKTLGVTVTTNTRTRIEKNTPTVVTSTTGALLVAQSGVIALTTASGNETRTLAAPTFPGQELTIYLKTNTGTDCTVTCATTINEAGNNTILFDATGESLHLRAVEEGATLRWRCAVADGATLSTV